MLYGGPPTSGSFNPENEVFEGRIMPRAEARALAVPTKEKLASTGEAEGEDQ